jgi:hypothetical protein
MAINSSENQYSYKGRGPLDAKSLVKTYADLLLPATWVVDGVDSAYNGMITAVWLNNTDTSKNGVYFLHDSAVTTARGKPDVTNEANWHKLGGINDLPGLTDQIAKIQEELEAVKNDVDELQESATVIIEPGQQLPETGTSGKLYVVLEEATTYVWYNNAYMPVGDGAGDETPEIQVIHGGSAR